MPSNKMICDNCRNVIVQDPIQKGGNNVETCEDCGKVKTFKGKIPVLKNKKTKIIPNYLKLYKYGGMEPGETKTKSEDIKQQEPEQKPGQKPVATAPAVATTLRECLCAFSRDTPEYEKFTCLERDEIQRIRDEFKDILKDNQSTSPIDFYKKFASEINCEGDTCVKDYLLMKAKSMEQQELVTRIYDAAQVITSGDEIPEKKTWLSNYIIDRVCFEIELNSKQNYFYQGCFCYDDFEDCLLETVHLLNPKNICKFIKEHMKKPRDTEVDINDDMEMDSQNGKHKLEKNIPDKPLCKLGYVLNTCHKYSPGQHWVAMSIIVENHGKETELSIHYYDSEGTTGPETEPLSCDANPDCPEKYLHYEPKWYEWFDVLKSEAKKCGWVCNDTSLEYNEEETEKDEYSCGYHGILFNYFVSIYNEPLGLIIMKVEAEDSKTLDDFVLEFYTMIFGDVDKTEASTVEQGVRGHGNVGGAIVGRVAVGIKTLRYVGYK